MLSTSAIIAGGGLALLTGGIAKADPAAPAVPAPSVPGLSVVEQFVDPSKAPQLLQTAASILGGAQTTPATPALPLTPPPVASASLNVPQPTLPGMPAALPGMPAATPAVPAALPGMPAATPVVPAALPGMPALTPAVPASAPGAAQPAAQLTLPQVPGLPVPLPQNLTLPTELTSFLGGTTMTPAQAAATAAGAPSAAYPGTEPALLSLFPTNALP
ncbi:hypothetical protein AWB99_22440 [Mycolicibacterium confluentis]|uniref:Uncharacterized protein n=1 Tax=Mycolicibacterium confluentis TaxID=28047 RepID=A0A7I7XT33_9MYCO|nr:hypothetical protein [Mycolicibacterium confluentis]MCV7321277.1 hypothetical protein [Mycolicibacterium confluentis]ORV25247.1 hypothetical protein AWB99_22440 [Mycolicibacterium confluentis]BBZ32243.1 hypothetical protein MCNF_08480 [Mycolicibacterium confluentis]